MKSKEFINESKNKGTYAGVHFSKVTKNAIASYINENNIPNSLNCDKLHTTILYSRKYCPNFKPHGKINPPLNGNPLKFAIWESRPNNEGVITNCLVLEYNCPELDKRHYELMDEHNATYEFDEYKTHITFSYDVGDLRCEDLPLYDGPIEIIEEYTEELDLDWAMNNSNER